MSSTAGTNTETKDFQSFEIASRLYGCCLAGRLTLHNERGKNPKGPPKYATLIEEYIDTRRLVG